MGGAEILALVRRDLLLEFDRLPGEGDVVAWQRRLANAIIAAESRDAGFDAADLRRHRHLLRVIGDALVHALLPSHTIRALSRHPGKPAALSAQGADFDFVFEVASRVRAAGAVPIVADLTTLIGIGDVVGWGAAGAAVFECKNRAMPKRVSTSGRVARQRVRGERAEEYLTSSRVEEEFGLRAAYASELPEPDWDAVRDLLDRCAASSEGVATWTLGPNDTLLAVAHGSDLDAVERFLPSGDGLVLPAMAAYWELVDAADHRFWAPSSYPVSGELRWQLLEGRLSLVRVADMGGLSAEFVEEGQQVKLVPRRGASGFEVAVEASGVDGVAFLAPLVELCMWMPVPVHALRASLVGQARQLVSGLDGAGEAGDASSVMGLADGDSFVFGMAYRDAIRLGSPPDTER